MPYRVVEYAPPHQRHGRRPTPGRSPHMTVYYGGRGVYGRPIPRAAHSRLVSVPPPPRFVRSQDIYSLGEEAYRLPYRTKVVHIEDLSNSRNYHDYDTESCTDLQLYDSETEVRRDASDILLRLAYGMPVPLYSVKNIPLRSSSELRDVVDVRRKFVRDRNHLSSMSRIQSEIYRMAMYAEPMRKPLSGKGNLACLSFAGGKPISRRQLRYVPEDTTIRDLINFRSFYNNLRVAATLGTFYKKPVTYHPLYKSKKSLLGLKDNEEKPAKDDESKWVKRSSAAVDADYKPRAERAVTKPELQQSYVLPGPRKSVIEVPEEVKSFTEPEPEVVVKFSRKSIQEDAPICAEPEVKKSIKISPRKKVKEELKEPEPEPEEVFQDAVKEVPVEKETVVEVSKSPEPQEPVPEPVAESEATSPINIESEIEALVETETKPAAVEPEIEPVQAEPEPEVEPEPEPAVEAEPEPEAIEEPVLAKSPSERAESREDQVASPLSAAADYETEAAVNGQPQLNGDVEEEIEEIRSPPPTKILNDEEPDAGDVEQIDPVLSPNYGEAEPDESVATNEQINGGEDEAREAAEEEDPWWTTDNEAIPKKQWRTEEFEDEDRSEEQEQFSQQEKEGEEPELLDCEESE